MSWERTPWVSRMARWKAKTSISFKATGLYWRRGRLGVPEPKGGAAARFGDWTYGLAAVPAS